jgi:hypothetical protein
MDCNAIYIFTCNRPIKLERLLNELCSIKREYRIYIIDDSSKRDSIEENRRITKKYTNTTYLGKTQYKEFYKMNGSSQNCQMLGDETWNLGIARNFALDYSNFRKYGKVLFIDDDISGINETILDNGFLTLTKSCFISCILKGLEDDSIIGHIAKEVGVIDNGPRMLSGGFLFLSPMSISHRFLNIYNEDWIIQLLEKEKNRIILPYAVCHNIAQKVQWTTEQVIFQEHGELIVAGLLKNVEALSLEYSFWEEVIENRLKFIYEIKEGSLKINNQHSYEICEVLLKWLKQIDGQYLKNYIEQNKN